MAHDISIIRPQVNEEDVKLRRKNISRSEFKKIKKALHSLHDLELMAQTVYKCQITKKESELNRTLIAAMLNEMGHYQDFQVKLYEYGLKPNLFRFIYWFAGIFFGTISKWRGEKAILKMGIWLESQAVDHYAELLQSANWDDESKKVLEKNQADEDGHIARWTGLLK